jgi:hypothetical protein
MKANDALKHWEALNQQYSGTVHKTQIPIIVFVKTSDVAGFLPS